MGSLGHEDRAAERVESGSRRACRLGADLHTSNAGMCVDLATVGLPLAAIVEVNAPSEIREMPTGAWWASAGVGRAHNGADT